MNPLSLPYIDQPPEFWQRVGAAFGAYVQEIYFPMSNHVVPSGRPVQSETNLIRFLEQGGLPKAVLVNPVVLPRPLEEAGDLIMNELYTLNRYYGIDRVTITNLRLGRLIRQELPQFRINASVLMGIRSPEQLVYLGDDVDEITLDTAILRHKGLLQQMRQGWNKSIKLIVNEGCLPGCPLRTQHFYEMSCESILPGSLCREMLEESPWLRLKSAWILPQHLHLLHGLYDVVKLAGRVTLQEPGKYFRVVRAYLEESELPAHDIGSGPAGMLSPMPISSEFYETTLNCDKQCRRCHYCQDYYERHQSLC